MNNIIQRPEARERMPAESVLALDGVALGRDERTAFDALKRTFDLAVALLALPVVLLISAVLLVANPIWNPGPVFFLQKRMGRDCRSFTAIKFRTMRNAERIARGPDDPLEHDRVTQLGRFLRVMRIDELPQFINVLNGDMSVVGPRPDFWDHAIHYLDTIPGYRERHELRPGITGLAQVSSGYAEGVSATIRKTRLDLRYIRARGLRMELYVLWHTLGVLLTGSGAR